MHLHYTDGLEDKHWSLGKSVLDIAGMVGALLEGADALTFALESDVRETLPWLHQRGLLVCLA